MAETTLRQVIFIRHGDAEEFDKKPFNGWYDNDLSKRGFKEAERAGHYLKKFGIHFNEAHTSLLKRSNKFLLAVLNSIGQSDIPITRSWKLNDRHYGDLTGMTRLEATIKYGDDVTGWKNGYDNKPPAMTKESKYYEIIHNDPVYGGGSTSSGKPAYPLTESFKDTEVRSVAYWKEQIEPAVKLGKNVLVVGHDASLRGIIKYLDNLTLNQALEISVAEGIPFRYEFDNKMQLITSRKYLADEEIVKEAIILERKLNRFKSLDITKPLEPRDKIKIESMVAKANELVKEMDKEDAKIEEIIAAKKVQDHILISRLESKRKESGAIKKTTEAKLLENTEDPPMQRISSLGKIEDEKQIDGAKKVDEIIKKIADSATNIEDALKKIDDLTVKKMDDDVKTDKGKKTVDSEKLAEDMFKKAREDMLLKKGEEDSLTKLDAEKIEAKSNGEKFSSQPPIVSENLIEKKFEQPKFEDGSTKKLDDDNIKPEKGKKIRRTVDLPKSDEAAVKKGLEDTLKKVADSSDSDTTIEDAPKKVEDSSMKMDDKEPQDLSKKDENPTKNAVDIPKKSDEDETPKNTESEKVKPLDKFQFGLDQKRYDDITEKKFTEVLQKFDDVNIKRNEARKQRKTQDSRNPIEDVQVQDLGMKADEDKPKESEEPSKISTEWLKAKPFNFDAGKLNFGSQPLKIYEDVTEKKSEEISKADIAKQAKIYEDITGKKSEETTQKEEKAKRSKRPVEPRKSTEDTLKKALDIKEEKSKIEQEDRGVMGKKFELADKVKELEIATKDAEKMSKEDDIETISAKLVSSKGRVKTLEDPAENSEDKTHRDKKESYLTKLTPAKAKVAVGNENIDLAKQLQLKGMESMPPNLAIPIVKVDEAKEKTTDEI